MEHIFAIVEELGFCRMMEKLLQYLVESCMLKLKLNILDLIAVFMVYTN